MTYENLTVNGEPARESDRVDAYGETYITLEHRESGEELGTVTEADIGGDQ